jgi:predicted small secreted protein
MKKLISLLTVLVLMGSVAGCSTVEGIGKDLKKGGEAIQKAANQ